MLSVLTKGVEVLQTPGALRALLTWPKFSLASYKIVRRLQQAGVAPMTIIDVGANVGQFSVAASKMFVGARLFPIEPDPRVAVKLRGNLDAVAADNLLVTAVGDRCGEATFNVNRDSQVSSLLPLGRDRVASFPDSTVLETITVPLTTLDSLFAGRRLEEPVLLKIDVQGFEDRVIAGAQQLLQQVEWVLMEVAFSSLYDGERDFESIAALMQAANFRFVRPINIHTSPTTGEIIEMDILFRRCESLDSA